MKSYDVVIVGGGCSAALLLLQLVEALPKGSHVAIIDASDMPTRGIAYRTRNTRHLLNVPAARMSAYPQKPEDFCNWLKASGKTFGNFDFVPRWTYGDYLEQRLAEATASQQPTLEWIKGTASGIEQVPGPHETKYVVQIAGHEPVAGRNCILAVGTPVSEWPSIFRSAGIKRADLLLVDPWKMQASSDVPKDSEVCVLGTGLTAADAVIELVTHSRPRKITMLSRHGLLSEVHKPELYLQPGLSAPTLPLRLRQVLRWVREGSRSTDWRRVVDALRPVTSQLWKGFTQFEKRQFLRHLRSHWDVARHRMAPQIREELDKLRSAGILEIVSGRVRKVEIQGDKVALSFHDRSHSLRELHIARVVNCTGFGDMAPPGSLLAKLESGGLLKRSQIGFGFEVDSTRSPGFFLIGSLRLGELWESIAVPELRQQARQIAETVAASCVTESFAPGASVP